MAHTKEPWRIVYYDCGDAPHYDHNGPCPSIMSAPAEDCAIVHWDGFKQEYWSSANGDQKQIEANARRIVACVNALAGYNPDAVAEVIEALKIMASAFAHEARNIEQAAALCGAEAALTRLRSIDND